MKRLFPIVVLILSLALVSGCRKKPAGSEEEDPDGGDPDASVQVAEFNDITSDLAALSVVEEPRDKTTIGEKRVLRLHSYLHHMSRILKRLGRYEHRYPNEEARKLIRRALRLTNAAVDAYKENEYRRAFRFARKARKHAHDAIHLLRPKHHNKHRDGG